MATKNKKEPLCRVRDIYRLINDLETEFYNKNGVKLNEGMLLCSLSKMGKSSSGQISELLGLTLSNSSKVIASAEKKGLVERTIGEEDKRQMFFQLTQQGKECVNNIHCQDEEIAELIEQIHKI